MDTETIEAILDGDIEDVDIKPLTIDDAINVFDL